jgi:hypothetical protein
LDNGKRQRTLLLHEDPGRSLHEDLPKPSELLPMPKPTLFFFDLSRNEALRELKQLLSGDPALRLIYRKTASVQPDLVCPEVKSA